MEREQKLIIVLTGCQILGQHFKVLNHFEKPKLFLLFLVQEIRASSSFVNPVNFTEVVTPLSRIHLVTIK